MGLGNSSTVVSPTDQRLDKYSERAVKALSRALGPGDHGIGEVNSRAGRMYKFSLPGDQRAGQGRMLVSPGGQVKIWHQTLQRPWLQAPGLTPIEIGGADKGRGPAPGYAIALKEFEQSEPGIFATARQKPVDIQRSARALNVMRPQLSDQETHDLALKSLAAHGWVAQRSSGGISYLHDGHGSSAAGRMAVNDGLAVCWTHHGGVPNLGEPWRPGQPTSNGLPTMIATGRDLAGIKLDVVTPAVSLSRAPQMTEQQKLEAIQAKWAQITEHMTDCPPSHRHLNKGAKTIRHSLPAEGLGVVGKGYYEGSIAMPMLRELSDQNPGKLEVVGVQMLTPTVQDQTDKTFLSGSSTAGAVFAPWPLPPVRDGKYDLAVWVESRDKSKPIVLCEGVATALAIHHSGAGHAVICYSSSNLPAVAKYFAEREFDQVHGVVIAADNDIGLHEKEPLRGKLKSEGIPKAIEAARACDGDVAYLGKSYGVGIDARDIYTSEGPSAVRSYIERAGKPDDVEARFNRTIAEDRAKLFRAQDIER